MWVVFCRLFCLYAAALNLEAVKKFIFYRNNTWLSHSHNRRGKTQGHTPAFRKKPWLPSP